MITSKFLPNPSSSSIFHDGYILDEHNNVIQTTLEQSIEWQKTRQSMYLPYRNILTTYTRLFRISSAFLGMDINSSPYGSPQYFETMIFDKREDRDGFMVCHFPPLHDLHNWFNRSWNYDYTIHTHMQVEKWIRLYEYGNEKKYLKYFNLWGYEEDEESE